jgi:hypothetical protein
MNQADGVVDKDPDCVELASAQYANTALNRRWGNEEATGELLTVPRRWLTDPPADMPRANLGVPAGISPRP